MHQNKDSARKMSPERSQAVPKQNDRTKTTVFTISDKKKLVERLYSTVALKWDADIGAFVAFSCCYCLVVLGGGGVIKL